MVPKEPLVYPSPTDHDAPSGRPTVGRSSGARWAGGIVLALMLYILSTGPVFKLVDAGYVSEDHLGVIYAPLFWVGQNTFVGKKCLRPALNWYWIEIWGLKL
jgi:hypothetical protein